MPSFRCSIFTSKLKGMPWSRESLIIIIIIIIIIIWNLYICIFVVIYTYVSFLVGLVLVNIQLRNHSNYHLNVHNVNIIFIPLKPVLFPTLPSVLGEKYARVAFYHF
jgi:hypothetical protein